MKNTRRASVSAVVGSLLLLAAALPAAEPASPGGSAAANPATHPAASPNSANDWPQWRGPNRDGVVPNSSKLADSWPKAGPKLLWKSGPIPGSDANMTGASLGQPGHSVACDGGASSPVVADGRVFVYVDWAKKYMISSKMLEAWGWLEGVPDELAEKIEKARVSRNQRLAAAALDKYIDDFLATLDPAQAKKFGDHIRKRIGAGSDPDGMTGAAGWRGMTALVKAGAQDKEFATFNEFMRAAFQGKHLEPPLGCNPTGITYIYMAALRNAQRADTVFCLDAATGQELWRKEFPGEGTLYSHYWFNGASATPAIADGKCYAVGSAGLYCLSAKDGTLIWKVAAGFTQSSPLVANGMVYVICPEANKKFTEPLPWGTQFVYAAGGVLSAFDARTGKLIWRQPTVTNTFNSVTPWSHAGKNYLLTVCERSKLYCLDADTGAVVWKSAESFVAESAAAPVLVGDTAVVRGTAAFRLTPEKAELIWTDKTGQGGSYYCGDPVVYQDAVYGASAYAPGYCKDLKTGAVKWQKPWTFCIAPVVADGKLFWHSAEDKIAMVKASPEGYVELGLLTPVSRPLMFSSPVIAGGKLYIRLCDCVACYDLTEAGNQATTASAPAKP